ncbi:MAG: hypothetical protein EB150_08720 [Nitrososphaeria archaeon]|nr:hypothetical protein [Nitrososphaeria archaeon]NDB52117.1 hypothetical protein [Nitrosopumilaceae archaeon]NDB88922.1 hypothetical protein [Nitrososphaerota archaeon]NDB47117.1 hypothetical protein [Nitrososphaeria archaeon]NDB63678.1 hypothetical protein [Nitrosopumilaceae archaeon]
MKVREKLIQLYSDLGVEPRLDNFASRKQLQKLTYLIEAFGIFLGFKFSWYLHGPYDRRLTAVLYDDTREESDRQVDNTFQNEGEIIKKLKEFLGRDIHSSRTLELIVSLHYLDYVGRKQNLTDDKIIEQLRSLKPQYTKEESAYYLKRIHQFMYN